MLQDASGIHPDVIAARGYRTVTVKARLADLGFAGSQQIVPTLVIPIHNVAGEVALYHHRPNEPRPTPGRAGKFNKYEFAARDRMAVDVHPHILEKTRMPDVPLFITEGVKKADAAVSKGMCCIAVVGTWNWRGTNEWGGKAALPDWDSIVFKGKRNEPRDVYIVFDSDVMQKAQVRKALERLTAFLELRGGNVRPVYLPSGEGGRKMGLDDFLSTGKTIDDVLSFAEAELRKPVIEWQEEREPDRTVEDVLPDVPVSGLVVPHRYILGPGKTLRASQGDGGSAAVAIAWAPIIITRRLEDIDGGNEALELAWREGHGDAGRWRYLTVPRGVALNRGKLVDTADKGFPAGSDNALDITRYLRDFEAVNQHRLPVTRISSRMGWLGRHGSDGFLCGHTHIQPCREGEGDECEGASGHASIQLRPLSPGDEQIANAFRQEGTLEGWKSTIKAVQSYPTLKMALYASFVPPLLEILGCSNFILDLANHTSTGKTTALRISASVWGNPDERSAESVIQSWDSTQVWTERAGRAISALPLFMDDSQRARKPQHVADVLYMVAQGRGRGRGNIQSTATTPNFHTVMISTGEMPATSFTEDGGTRTRCIELLGPPFGATDASSAKIVIDINREIRRNYGSAGPALVRFLLTNHNQWPEWKTAYQEMEDRYVARADGSAEGGRLATYIAAAHFAGLLASAAEILPWRAESDPFSSLLPGIFQGGENASGEARALRHVYSIAVSRQPSFIGRQEYLPGDGMRVKQPTGGWAGRWDDGEDWKFIAFFPHYLEALLAAAGYRPSAIIPGWRSMDWLDAPREGGRERVDKKVRLPRGIGGEGETARMIVIKRDAIDGILGS